MTLLTHYPNTSWIHEIHELKRVHDHLNFVPVPGLPQLWGHSVSRHFVYGIFGWFCDITCFCWLVHSPWRNLFKRYRFWRRCSWWPLLFRFGVREWRFPSSSNWLSSLELMRSSPQGPYRFDTLSQPTKGRIFIQLVPLYYLCKKGSTRKGKQNRKYDTKDNYNLRVVFLIVCNERSSPWDRISSL